MAPSRRSFFKKLAAGGAVLAGGGAAAFYWLDRRFNPRTPLAYPIPSAAEAGLLAPTPACDDGDHAATPAQTEGPFYTPETPRRNVLREPGIVGRPLRVEGRVLTTACVPIAGAVLDFWSCDGEGHYDNAGFRLRGHQYTDAEGGFVLETVRPSAYGQFMVRRTPHIHVKLQGRDTALLTTQLYFPDAPENADDGLFDERLLMALEERPDGSLLGRFDFVLA